MAHIVVATFDRQTARQRVRETLRDTDDLWSPQAARDLVVEFRDLCGLEGGPAAEPPPPEALERLGGVTREFAHRMWGLGSVRAVEVIGIELGEELGVGFRHLDSDDHEQLRSLLLGDLWQLLEADFRQARNVFAKTFSDTFRHATTESERRDLEQWFRDLLDELPEDDHVDSPRSVAGHWMVEYLEQDLDDDDRETICRETRQFVRLTRRALEEDRDDEALKWAERVTSERIADLCRLYFDRDRLDDLVEADIVPDPEYEPIPLDELYDTAEMLLAAGEFEAALPWVEVSVRERPLDRTLPGLREAAEAGDCWNVNVREALLGQVREHWPSAAFEHHLAFDDLGRAFEMWESYDDWDPAERRDWGTRLLKKAKRADSVDIAVSVALALADERIDQRGRQNYRRACRHLDTARSLIEELDYPMEWPEVIAEYEEQLDRLPAFRDEAEEADLLTRT